MFKTAIELFLGEHLVEMTRADDVIEFITITGHLGQMVPNFSGNWDIWVGEEVVYEVENELEPLLNHYNDKDLINLYEYARKIDQDQLKFKSRQFLNIVQGSIEKILVAGSLPLDGRAIVGIYEVIYKNNRKFLISLN